MDNEIKKWEMEKVETSKGREVIDEVWFFADEKEFLSCDVICILEKVRRKGHNICWGVAQPSGKVIIHINKKDILFENEEIAVEYLKSLLE